MNRCFMNNIDDMMVMWKEMDRKLSSLLEENRKLTDEIKKNKLISSKEKLTRKYRSFIIMEAVCIPLMFFLLGVNPIVVNQYRWPALIYFVCFFLLEIGLDGYLLYKLKSIDIYNDSIVEISRQARANWRTHKIAVLIGIPVAIGAVVLFCLAMGSEVSMLWGVFIGGVIGLGIGMNEFFKFMKSYRAMSQEE